MLLSTSCLQGSSYRYVLKKLLNTSIEQIFCRKASHILVSLLAKLISRSSWWLPWLKPLLDRVSHKTRSNIVLDLHSYQLPWRHCCCLLLSLIPIFLSQLICTVGIMITHMNVVMLICLVYWCHQKVEYVVHLLIVWDIADLLTAEWYVDNFCLFFCHRSILRWL